MLLSLAYDGRRFCGFAPQRSQRTIAGELLGALREMDPGISSVRGGSRTDSGVHARDQRVAFDPSRDFPLSAWTKGAAKQLPEEISIMGARYVDRGFSPRHEALAKTYRYVLSTSRARDPFEVGRSWRVPELADDAALEIARNEAAAALGTHDFAAFRSARDPRAVTVRTLSRVDVARSGGDGGHVHVEVRGDHFLYNMVRILVGTVVDVARGRSRPGAVARALASKDRRDAGITAPPDGLYLWRYELRGIDPEPQP